MTATSLCKRCRAPRAVHPELPEHAPAAFVAGVLADRDLPLFSDLSMTPWALPHEEHQIPALALRILAAGDVAPIGVFTRRHIFKTRPIAPRAILPVELHTAIASRAGRRKRRFFAKLLTVIPAPRAGQHVLRNRPGALA